MIIQVAPFILLVIIHSLIYVYNLLEFVNLKPEGDSIELKFIKNGIQGYNTYEASVLASGEDPSGSSEVLDALKSSFNLPSHKFMEEMMAAKRKQLAEAQQV